MYGDYQPLFVHVLKLKPHLIEPTHDIEDSARERLRMEALDLKLISMPDIQGPCTRENYLRCENQASVGIPHLFFHRG